ncbi:MAG: hypothetical protein RL026_1225 [Pseudomonadota bacterium]|jgi:protein SCO1/2
MQSQRLVLQSGTWLPSYRPLQAFQLETADGTPFTLQSLQGRPHLVFFGFTHCPDICPTTLALVTSVVAREPLPGLQPVFVSVDPERDDAVTLRRYADAFNGRFLPVRGSEQALQPLMKSLSAVAAKVPTPDGQYTVDHSAHLYYLDAQGRLAAVFTPPLDAAGLEADLRRIAAALP